MNFLEQNLAALAAGQPELAARLEAARPPQGAALEPSRSGPPCLSLGGVRLTSAVDPVDEGRRIAAAAPRGPLAAFGFALAYHLEPLAGRDLVIYEPDEGLLALALTARDLSAWLGSVRLVTRPEDLGDLSGRAPLIHRASARLRPVEAQGLEARLRQGPAARIRPARPRVLVVPPLHGGSLPVAGWCAQALDHLGCQVRTVPLDLAFPLFDRVRSTRLEPARVEPVKDLLMRFLGEVAALEAAVFQPHLVLVMAQAPLDRRAIAELRRGGAVVAFWFIEDFRHLSYFREVAASYDWFFHIQGAEMVGELERLGARQAFLPMAAHPPVHRPVDLSADDQRRFGAEVGFLGAGYPNRVKGFERLATAGLPLKVWGTGWPAGGPLGQRLGEGGRRLSTEEVVKVYNACKVVLNLHSSTDPDRPAAQADFVNPRTFEVAACGGFQLVDRSAGLEDFLAPGKEVAVFGDLSELIGQAEHYLKNPEMRWSMARAARRRVLAEHTYYHRMESLMNACLGRAPARNNAGGGPWDPAENLIEQLARANAPA